MKTTYQVFEIFGHELKRAPTIETNTLYFQFASDYETEQQAIEAIQRYYAFCKSEDLSWLLHNKFVVLTVHSYNS